MIEKQKILTVDDRKENLVALRQVLNNLEAEIIEATSGDQALAATLDHEFALAILDVRMPGMDGYELAEHLRSDPNTRHIPIIFLTAVHSDEERVFKGYEVGAVDYIVKPYTPGVLLSKVRVFLDLARAHGELAEKVVALTASEERYRSLVTTIPDIVYRIDKDGRFTYLNDAIHSLGYTPEDLLGTHFSKILLPADVETVSRELVLPGYSGRNTGPDGAPKLFDERRTGKRKTMGLEVCLVQRRGARAVPAELHSSGPDFITVEINCSGIYTGTPGGKKTIYLGTVGVIRDITERKRAEEELARHRDQLENLVQERTKKILGLYAISNLIAAQFDSIDEVLRQAVNLIPSGFQYPEIACARITFEDREFVTPNFRETRWRLSADIPMPTSDSPAPRASVLVGYLEEKADGHAGPFLEEERHFIDDIARQLSVLIQREQALEKLRQSEESLKASLRELNIRDRIKEVFLTEPGVVMYSKVLETMLDSFESPLGVFGYINEAGDLVVPSLTSDTGEGGTVREKDIVFPRRSWGDAYWLRAIREKKGSFSNEPSTLMPEGHIRIHRHITMPILDQDQAIGLFMFANRETNYTPGDLALLERISGTVAPVLKAHLEHQKQEKIILDSEKRYRELVHNANSAIIRWRRDGAITFFNEYAQGLFGYTPEEIIGRHIGTIVPERESRGRNLSSLIRDIFDQPDRYKESMNENICRDGRRVWMLWTNKAIIDDQGQVEEILAIGTDITERRKLEEQFQQAQKMETVGRLAGGVAHDFNNLLTVIIGNCTLSLMGDDLAAELREDIQEIKRAGERAAELTRQLLAFSRKQILELKIININNNIIDMEKMLRRMIGEDVRLALNLAPDLGSVKVDPGQLEQVIMNLAVNARDAMPEGGSLTIETSNVLLGEEYQAAHPIVVPGPYVLLTVTDTGIGMDAETRKRIFEPFFTTKIEGKGTGLGLSTVYGIVKQSNGFIWVYSEPGQGTTFKIYLPTENAARDFRRDDEERIGAYKGHGTILIVEDEESVRKLADRIVKHHGFNTIAVASAEEALAAVEKTKTDLVLTDVVMPGMNGPVMAKKMKSRNPTLKFLFMSGYSEHQSVVKAISEINGGFIQKPFDRESLMKKVKFMMEQ
ncbi:MAG: response regulator [Thermodesulfobacteriota bacterium]